MARDREITTTQTWDDYQRGLDYLRRRNYFDDMDKANRFYVATNGTACKRGPKRRRCLILLNRPSSTKRPL